jgi:hypothetical protein
MRSLFQLSTGEKDDLEKLDQDKIKKTNKSKEFSDD